jgi:hypothetical protein
LAQGTPAERELRALFHPIALVARRERLAVYGGVLQAGPRLGGGYRVDARIPVEVT